LTIGKTVITFSRDETKKGVAVEHIIPVKPSGQRFGAAMMGLSLA
jgi:hypothetical protein